MDYKNTQKPHQYEVGSLNINFNMHDAHAVTVKKMFEQDHNINQYYRKFDISSTKCCAIVLGNLASCFVVFIFLLDFAAIHSGNGNYFYLFTKFFKSLSFCI